MHAGSRLKGRTPSFSIKVGGQVWRPGGGAARGAGGGGKKAGAGGAADEGDAEADEADVDVTQDALDDTTIGEESACVSIRMLTSYVGIRQRGCVR
jgi:hypothetical protein